MPGKPAVLGKAGNKPLLGVPGYPVSAIVIAREILRPALEKFLGSAAPAYPTVRAVLPKKIASHLGLEEFIRVTLGRVNEKLVAVPLGRGAGVITTMVHADGLMRIPSLVEGLNAGEEAEVELLRPIADIENTILCTGSHDLAIGVLEDQLKLRHPDLKIAATNVGSLGGLLALQRSETHMNQVLSNLLSNALKFTEIGGEIEVAARTWGDSEIILAVKDSGIGIPQDELELIFDKYRQGGGGRHSTHTGTGLGLAICKKIVEAHADRVQLVSRCGLHF